MTETELTATSQNMPYTYPEILMPSSAQIRAINRYQLVTTNLQHADIGLLFGGQRSGPARIKLASELWHQGLVDRLIISGANPDDFGRTEAEKMKAGLLALGVPARSMLVEDQATNSGENVVFCMRLLEENGLLAKVQSVICIGRYSSSRRYLMTVERHWPSVTKMLAAAHYHDVDRHQWHRDPDLCSEVLGEWKKFRPYLKRGYISELNPKTCTLTKQ